MRVTITGAVVVKWYMVWEAVRTLVKRDIRLGMRRNEKKTRFDSYLFSLGIIVKL